MKKLLIHSLVLVVCTISLLLSGCSNSVEIPGQDDIATSTSISAPGSPSSLIAPEASLTADQLKVLAALDAINDSIAGNGIRPLGMRETLDEIFIVIADGEGYIDGLKFAVNTGRIHKWYYIATFWSAVYSEMARTIVQLERGIGMGSVVADNELTIDRFKEVVARALISEEYVNDVDIYGLREERVGKRYKEALSIAKLHNLILSELHNQKYRPEINVNEILSEEDFEFFDSGEVEKYLKNVANILRDKNSVEDYFTVPVTNANLDYMVAVLSRYESAINGLKLNASTSLSKQVTDVANQYSDVLIQDPSTLPQYKSGIHIGLLIGVLSAKYWE